MRNMFEEYKTLIGLLIEIFTLNKTSSNIYLKNLEVNLRNTFLCNSIQ